MTKTSTRVLLANRKIDSQVNVFMHAFGMTLIGVILRIMIGSSLNFKSFEKDWILMICLTLIGIYGQYSLERALKMGKNTSIMAIFFSLGICYTFLFDMIIFGKAFIWRKLWACLIVIGSIAVIMITKK